MRSVILPIWNSYSFFVTYARVDNWEPGEGEAKPPANPAHPLDRWILSSLFEMVDEIRESMDTYNLQKAANRFEKFVEDLTNWYIRRSRRRFWKSQNDNDKDEAYHTLHYVLLTFSRTAAPFIPFITEEIYRNLRTPAMPESVHLCNFPEGDKGRRDEYLEKQMDNTMTAVSLGRFLRTQHTLKVRQPLRKAIIVASEEISKMLNETSDIIAEELNVKEINFQADEEKLVSYKVKANFKTLGPKLGKDMKVAANAIAAFDAPRIKSIISGTPVSIPLSDGKQFEVSADDVIIQREEKEGMTVATDKGITVALDTVLDDALRGEGFAREFVSRIQNIRKEMGLEVSDRIVINYSVPAEFRDALDAHSDYICNETLTVSMKENKTADAEKTDVNGSECFISVLKA